jgi:glycosyltransferase involved in cell wall biosynthesis
MHWTYPVPLRMAGWINIYTIHDLIPLAQPQLSPINRRRHRAVMRELVRHADRIVTVSEAARADIVSMLQVSEASVVNCGQAVSAAGEQVRSAPVMGLQDGGYFIFCGAVEPRKNLHRLLQAHAVSGVATPLVIVGPDGWRSKEINKMIDRAPNVLRCGYLNRGELLGLIRNARGLLFPSLAEGFGLPVAEAMQLGTPVLASSSGALAEVAGDAALLVDPADVQAIASGIHQLSSDDALVADLSARGRVRAECFLPSRFAARLAAVYDETLAAYSGFAATLQRVQ